MRLLRRKQWVNSTLTQLMSTEFFQKNVDPLITFKQMGHCYDGYTVKVDPSTPSIIDTSYLPPERRYDWDEFPDDMPMLPHGRQAIFGAYFFLLFQITVKYDKKLGHLVRKAIERAIAGDKKYMDDINYSYEMYRKSEYRNYEEPDGEKYNFDAYMVAILSTHPGVIFENTDDVELGTFLYDFNYKHRFGKDEMDEESSFEDICDETLNKFKSVFDLEGILVKGSDEKYVEIGWDEKYWEEKMEEFYKEFKEQIDSLAETWMIDLCRYKFIL